MTNIAAPNRHELVRRAPHNTNSAMATIRKSSRVDRLHLGHRFSRHERLFQGRLHRRFGFPPIVMVPMETEAEIIAADTTAAVAV